MTLQQKHLIQQQQKQLSLPLWKIGLFIGHCTVGMFGIGYFTYKTFLNRKQSVYDKKTKSIRTKSLLFINLSKTIAWSSFFLISSGFLLSSIRPTQTLFSQALVYQKSYMNTIKVDKLFQDYYIFQTMQYFGISKQLIQKTHQQLELIKDNIKESGIKLDSEKLSIDKQLIKMALAKQNINNKEKDMAKLNQIK